MQLTFTYSSLIVLIYLVVIYPLLHSCIPRISTTVKFVFYIFIFLVIVLILLGIEALSYLLESTSLNQTITSYKCSFQTDPDPSHPESRIDVHWVILSNVLNDLSMFLFILSGINSESAEAQFNMKGLIATQ